MSSLSPQAFLVVLFQALLQNNDNTSETGCHLTGGVGSGRLPSLASATVGFGQRHHARSHGNINRSSPAICTALHQRRPPGGAVSAVNLDIEAIPHRISVDLESARLVSNNSVHAGDTVMVEATLRPWHQPERNMRIAVKLPARLEPGNLRLLARMPVR